MSIHSVRIEEELGGERAEALARAMAARIVDSRKVLVTSHINPDGDAMGSQVALALALRRLGKEVHLVNDSPPPDKYRFLDPEGTIEFLEGAPSPGRYRGVDLGILLDTSEPSRTGRLEELFFQTGLDRICMDHHPGPASPLFLHHWVAERAPATGNLVLRLLDRLKIQLDREIATPLLVAIGTDTGWFRFSNTSSLALRDAARLLEAGVEAEKIHRRIYEESSAGRMVLMGRLLAGIQIELGGKFAWSLLDRQILKNSGVPHQELDGLAEQLAALRGPELVAMVLEVDPGSFKVSLRGRGNLAVNSIARDFSGGGHAKAAGFRFVGSWQELHARLKARVSRELGD